MVTPKPQNLYQIKVQLKDYRPSIYRTFVVSEFDTFQKLHNYIQHAFGLYDYHLWHFYTVDQHLEIVVKDEDFEPFFSETKSPRTTKLKDIFWDRSYKKLHYEYDFGDSWEFIVELQKVIPANLVSNKVPLLLKAKWGMLIEDCWGAWGLKELMNDYEKKVLNKDFFDNWEEFEDYLVPQLKEIDFSKLKL